MKTSAILVASATLMALPTFCSCGKIITVRSKSDNVERKIDVSGQFTAIESNDRTDVSYVDGPIGITLSAPEELIDRVDVKVKNGVLVISNKTHYTVNGNYNTHLTVSAPGVKRFYSNGTGDFDIQKVSGGDIIFETKGTGDFKAKELDCSSLTVTGNGTGDVEIESVSAAEVRLSLYGTGDIEIDRIKAGKLAAKTNGTGDIQIGDGNVDYAELTNFSTGDINMAHVTVGNVKQSNVGTGDINIYNR